MRISRPSPAMVVAVVALIVACAGTATAASVVLIKNSAQVKSGALDGTDLKDQSIRNTDLATGAVDARVLKRGAVGTAQLDPVVKGALTSQGFTATEAVRKSGPTVNPSGGAGGQSIVATVQGLTPGTYTLLAKTTIAPVAGTSGVVGDLTKSPKTAEAHCRLDGSGDVDDSSTPIGTPFSVYAGTVNTQLTRTLATTSDVTLTCDANVGWMASDTSIIALKLSGSSRQDSTG